MVRRSHAAATLRRLFLAMLVAGLSVFFASDPSGAANHLIQIDEVMAGAGGNADIQFVELKMTGSNQTLVGATRLRFFNGAGALTNEYTLTNHVGNGALGASILIGTTQFQSASTAQPDFIMPSLVNLTDGKVCFPASGDCVEYGNFTGSANPAPALPITGNSSLKRVSNTTNDFQLGIPAPRNNSNVQGTVTVGDTTAPGAPTNLVATAGDKQVSVDWDDNTEGDLAGYNVYRSTTQSGPYTNINASLVATSAYVDPGLPAGVARFYVATAVDDTGNESGNSNEASATPFDALPAPPTNLAATAGNRQVALEWDDNTENDLAGYNVYRSTAQGVQGTKINPSLITAGASAYIDTGLAPGIPYFYVVTAVDNAGNESGVSNEASATPLDAPPGPPTNLVATAGERQVALDWDDNTEPDLAGYNVYSSTTQGGPYTQINLSLVASATSEYVDAGLPGGTIRFYVVKAVDDGLNVSGSSNEASATPSDSPPATPTGLDATAGDEQVALDWDDSPEDDIVGYFVYRSLVRGGPYDKLTQAPIAASQLLDEGLIKGATYHYVVSAVEAGGNESPASAEVSSTTFPPPTPIPALTVPGALLLALGVGAVAVWLPLRRRPRRALSR